MSLFLTQSQLERANLCIPLCLPETSRSHHAQQSELAVPAQHCPAIPGSSPRNSTCSSSFYSSSQLAQHFCTIYIFTLARPKISVAARNECRAIGLGSSFRRGIASPLEGNGFLPEGFPRRGGQPFPALPHCLHCRAELGFQPGSLVTLIERSRAVLNSHWVHSSDSSLLCFANRAWKLLLKAQEVKNHPFQPPVTSGYFCDKLTQAWRMKHLL